MASQFTDETKALIQRLKTATDNIAARFSALLVRIQNDPTPEEMAQIEADFKVEVDRLEAMGTDPANPVPNVPPPPPPVQ